MLKAYAVVIQYMETLPQSFERSFLERGMHAMQRRSGRIKIVPDQFVITSLDVIIKYDHKLGEGGFAQVYEGDWKGTKVAVKVLESGISTAVRWYTKDRT